MVKELLHFLGAFSERRVSISSAYIIWSFILNCSPPPPIQPVSPLLSSLFCLTYFCPGACKYVHILSPFSQLAVCVCLCLCLCVCAHTKLCVTSYLFKPNSCHFFVLSHKAAPHACACSRSLRFRAELKETWINVFRVASVPFFISYS